MSPALESAESQWQAQLSAMRAAIAELNLPKDTEDSKPYGYDLALSDADLTWSPRNASEDDLWDLIDSGEELRITDTESASTNGFHTTKIDGEVAFDTKWLQDQCTRVVSQQSGLDAIVLQEQLLDILRSNDEDVQMRLVDILGFYELDLVSNLVSHRQELLRYAIETQAYGKELPTKLLTRAEREEALRRQDFEHKTANLQPSISRSEPQYPHVYSSKTSGNVLSAFGQKYALPVGSERKEHEKYEEFSVPASRVGTLAAGEQLVQIQEMDKLCKGTFKGYKTLNRMQSLVYPVAYKTSENMLICAPTGAVSPYR